MSKKRSSRSRSNEISPLGRYIDRLLQSNGGLTVNEFGRQYDIPATTVHDLRRAIHRPTVGTLQKLAGALTRLTNATITVNDLLAQFEISDAPTENSDGIESPDASESDKVLVKARALLEQALVLIDTSPKIQTYLEMVCSFRRFVLLELQAHGIDPNDPTEMQRLVTLHTPTEDEFRRNRIQWILQGLLTPTDEELGLVAWTLTNILDRPNSDRVMAEYLRQLLSQPCDVSQPHPECVEH